MSELVKWELPRRYTDRGWELVPEKHGWYKARKVAAGNVILMETNSRCPTASRGLKFMYWEIDRIDPPPGTQRFEPIDYGQVKTKAPALLQAIRQALARGITPQEMEEEMEKGPIAISASWRAHIVGAARWMLATDPPEMAPVQGVLV